jgi:hypothetical protein
MLLIVVELAMVDSLVGIDDSAVTIALVVFPLSFINFLCLLAEVNAIAIELLTTVSVTCKLVFIVKLTISNVVTSL